MLLNARKGANFRNGTVDTIPYFDNWFITGSRNSVYTYSMIGHNPKAGGTTTFIALMLPVSLYLNDALGNPVYVLDATNGGACSADPTSVAGRVANSPIFNTASYGGPSPQTGQYDDANQRVTFRNSMSPSWHTVQNLQNADCSSHGYWQVGLPPGTWAELVDNNNNPIAPVVDIEVMFPLFQQILALDNLFYGTPNSTMVMFNSPTASMFDAFNGGCCIGGFHTADPGYANPAGISVWMWADYIEPGVFGDVFTDPFHDTGPLSHEMSEAFNDPFVNTNVAAWVDGNVSFAQGNLETGDAIEAMLPADNSVHVNMNSYNYTLQNEALLDWFTRNPYSGGLYSWPNANTLSVPHNPAGWVYGQGSAGFFFGPPF
ncbi:MAG: hypothetical protein NVS9B15_13790 [Acidobacteriaceae bacterium]